MLEFLKALGILAVTFFIAGCVGILLGKIITQTA